MVDRAVKTRQISREDRELCQKWIEDGYVILPNFFPESVLDRTWNAYERAISSGSIEPDPRCQTNGLPDRKLNAHWQVAELEQLLKYPAITRVISLR